LNNESNGGPFWTGSEPPASSAEAPRANFYWTGPDYARTMQIPLVRGRYLNAADTLEAERVVVIDSVVARTYFADRDPVGQTLTIGHWGTARIVGVVGHVRHWGLDDANLYTQNQIYCSFFQLSDQFVPLFLGDLTVAVRTPLDVASAMPAIKVEVYNGVGDQPIYNVRAMQETVSKSMRAQRFPMILLGAFAGLALALASVGIYGTISYWMTQRTREMGIRMALGAEQADVLRIVLGQAIRLALAGIAAGVAAALILTRALQSFASLLYGVRPWDPSTLIAVSVLVMTVALLACYIPARRVASVDSMIVLRGD
jgi:predicted permease